MAQRTFERGLPTGHVIEKMLLDHGMNDAMATAVALAGAIGEAADMALSDIEYGDCYLCSIFCLAARLRETANAAADALTEMADRFSRDVDYLIYAKEDEIADLRESGWDRFMRYHDHEDAILPQAYLHLLSQVVRQRRMGSDTPYADLDPMILSDPITLAALEIAWESKGRVLVGHWDRLVERVQELADENDVKFWRE
ncbi:hypothetical protein FKO01_04210 [Mesorhizobium sp. B2-3-3]|nr:hypothetical protein FKO01_04210 [Mesorhizobium sp. B2-3-3]